MVIVWMKTPRGRIAIPSTEVIATRYPKVAYCCATACDWYMAIAITGGRDPLSIRISVTLSSPALSQRTLSLEGLFSFFECCTFPDLLASPGSWPWFPVLLSGLSMATVLDSARAACSVRPILGSLSDLCVAEFANRMHCYFVDVRRIWSNFNNVVCASIRARNGRDQLLR